MGKINIKLVYVPRALSRKPKLCTKLCTQRKSITFAETDHHMEVLSVRDYRKNLAASFTRANSGEQVLIRRKNQIFALVSVGREDLVMSEKLQARIREVEKECREGRCVTCKNKEEIANYIDSL